MSSIKVRVSRMVDLRVHPNADALEIATIEGWQVCVKKGVYREGDAVVYFEQGTVIPPEMAERLGIANYLSNKTDIDGAKVPVVHRIRLRGEPSFGLVLPVEKPEWKVGDEVAAHYGARKYYPPVKARAGDMDADLPEFPAYTDVENLRSYPDILRPGEPVSVTEKIHGTNCRVGFVLDEARSMLKLAGSRSLRRKRPESDEAFASNTYWFPWTLPGVAGLLRELFEQGHVQAVLYGEVYGRGVQEYHYGQRGLAFRAFDLMLDGKYVDTPDFVEHCRRHGVETAPPLFSGPFEWGIVRALSDGDSVIGGAHGREGVVVKPLVERSDARIGRVILKYLGDQYLFGKAAEKDTTDQ